MFRVAKTPKESLALTNCLIVSKHDFPSSAVKHVLVNQIYAFSILVDESCQPGEIGFSNLHRRWANLSLGEQVQVQPFDPTTESSNCYMSSAKLEVGFHRKALDIKDEFDAGDMQKVFCTVFGNQIFTSGQEIVFDYRGIVLAGKFLDIDVVDLDMLKKGGQSVPPKAGINTNNIRGIVMQQTSLNFVKTQDSSIKLKGSKVMGNTIIQPNFKFEDMGIGGLDQEFSSIFRRAFASRIFPPALVEKLGIQHVKGILLFGPPGTGKTLMARQIGKMLNAKEPKIVNGPEILNKFVGASEENIRKLFKEAEDEYKLRGDDSDLHIIIFDEIDAICKQRGSKNDGTGVGDSIVNQLLSKMDGVEQLNNILVIGMTNRLDMIDEALLRPGRLEVHMEIGLPDEKGRLQICKIHTSKMRDNNMLAPDVDLSELAQLTKNFSGAEIAGLVKSASSFAFNRHVKVGTLAQADNDLAELKISRADFIHALDEVKPAFGVAENEMKSCIMNGIIHYAPYIERILDDGQLFTDQVKKSTRSPLVSVLLHGTPGSGKTALAATIAMASEFPYIKLISSDNMIGYSESAKMSAISKVFMDSYKSPFSVIVIDSIERILDFVPIGPRFSNGVLQTLLVLLKKTPPNGKKLLILATTNQKELLNQMELGDAFNAEIRVPNISDLHSIENVVSELKLFSDGEKQKVIESLSPFVIDGSNLSIGIKKLIMLCEMARQDTDKVEKFVSVLKEQLVYPRS